MALRQLLHLVMVATQTRFPAQVAAMEYHVPPLHFQAHTVDHAEITLELTRLIGFYSSSQDIPATLAGVERLLQRIEAHINGLDAELDRLYMASIPPL